LVAAKYLRELSSCVQGRNTMQFKRTAVAFTGAAIAVWLAACGSNGGSQPSSAAAPTTATTMSQFGPACDQVPANGAGSFHGMAAAPVATAASSNPLLSTLVTAVQKANLADTLNGAKNITVFAPDNGAFGKIPASTLDKVLADNATLTKILEYHVVPEKITPAQLASGTFKTLEGGTIQTSGGGADYTIAGTAHVVCGNVQTANATVYIIDGVLMPPSS
jgi:uncharacterized surface protein with fasciclin (FAS1) repeats